MKARYAALLTLMFTAIGCGRTPTDGGVVPGEHGLEAAYCRYIARCSAPFLPLLGGTVESCAVSLESCPWRLAAPLALDEEEARDCAARLVTQPCGPNDPAFLRVPSICQALLSPIVSEGESCKRARCADGLECAGSRTCPTCLPPAREGDACGSDFPRYCGRELRCLDDVCTPYGAVGEPCAHSYDCASAHCENDRCAEPVALGGRCGDEALCFTGPCVDGICTANPPPEKPGLGDACDQGRCARDLACMEGRCVRPACTGITVGQPCPCPDELVCDDEAGHCVERLPPGAACDAHQDACAQDEHCDSESARCVPSHVAGGPCAGGPDCQKGLFCNHETQTCEPLRPDGAPCNAPQQCTLSRCDEGRCGYALCGS